MSIRLTSGGLLETNFEGIRLASSGLVKGNKSSEPPVTEITIPCTIASNPLTMPKVYLSGMGVMDMVVAKNEFTCPNFSFSAQGQIPFTLAGNIFTTPNFNYKERNKYRIYMAKDDAIKELYMAKDDTIKELYISTEAR